MFRKTGGVEHKAEAISCFSTYSPPTRAGDNGVGVDINLT
jgi:hypothetical protein